MLTKVHLSYILMSHISCSDLLVLSFSGPLVLPGWQLYSLQAYREHIDILFLIKKKNIMPSIC